MKKSQNYTARKLQGKIILMPCGKAAIDMDNMVSMNASGSYVWEALGDKDFTTDDIVAILLDHYVITPEIARKEADSAIAQWLECGAIG